jgi:Zn-dependent metalloprotease
MNNFIKLMAAVLCGPLLIAQHGLNNVARPDASKNWWSFNAEKNVEANSFFNTYKTDLGLGSEYSFTLLKSQEDLLGMTHDRYAQQYQGVSIEGAQFILHSQNNRIVRANGRLVYGLQGSASPTLSFEEALSKAKDYTGATVFYWEVPAMEALIKDAKQNPNATFFPKNELVWIDSTFSQNGDNYRLAYKMDLYFEAHEDHRTFYVDAHTGDLIWEEHKCHTGSANGQAQTKYHGLRNIITDSVSATKYVLRDDTRGGGIETYNAQNGTRTSQAIDFEDTDNFWDNANPAIDEAATDAHWGAEVTYDYFLQEHNRNSYDDNGSKIISYVHWDQNWFNASWNGIAMRYGDGNGNPLISVDVVGHELAHGVTGNSAGLIYANESGALNESFSDIFGNAIEFKVMGNSANWEIGILDFRLRNMANPKAFGDPNTYFGVNWYTGSGDNGGVHINSGVQNYWFYLLSEGGQGTNDIGNPYQVDSLGITNAAEIAYRNLNYYLTPSSTYADARRGSIAAAEDIYGNCSYEANLVAKAWYAVGIGGDTVANDLQAITGLAPLSSCDIGSQEDMAFNFVYYRSGCDSIIETTDTLFMGYSVNNGPAIIEAFIPGAIIKDGDTVSYTFNTKQDFLNIGTYSIKYWVKYATDFYEDNDTVYDYEVKVLGPLTDGDSISFEFQQQTTENLLYSSYAGANGIVRPSFQAKNTGFRGLEMSGQNVSFFNIDYPSSESEIFTKNPESITKACMCVDASTMAHVTLQFDLRQTFSSRHSQRIGTNANQLTTSLQTTIDGQKVGPMYHPTTSFSDVFTTHFLNLDRYAGTQFEFCLEGKHFYNRTNDPASGPGDNSYVDNIKLLDFEFIGEDELALSGFGVYPNPTAGIINIDFESNKAAITQLKLIDMRGNIVLNKIVDGTSGKQALTLDISNNPEGIYLLQLLQGSQIINQKIRLN